MKAKTWKLNPTAVKLLRKAKRAILANPNSYRQDQWHCGTAACVAGHVAMAAGAKPVKIDHVLFGDMFAPRLNNVTGKSDSEWKEVANRVLSLTDGQTYSLFSQYPDESWPEPFSYDWNHARTRTEKAEVAARRIEHFIETGQ